MRNPEMTDWDESAHWDSMEQGERVEMSHQEELDKLRAERDRARDTAARYEEELALWKPVLDAVRASIEARKIVNVDELRRTCLELIDSRYRAAVSAGGDPE